MFKIKFPTGETCLTEKPTFVYKHSSGNAYVRCDQRRSDGVMHKGTYYPYSGGVAVYEVDAAEQFVSVEKMVQAIKEGVNDV